MKLLFLDIETSPALVYTWGLFKQDISIDQIVEPTSVLCWAAKWLGDKEVIYDSCGGPPQGKAFEKMIRHMHRLLTEADAVCHFNGASFDIPRLNAEFVRLGLKPPPPIPQIDLKRVVNQKFGTTSSKLAFLGPYLGIGQKVKNSGWDLWRGCLNKDKKSWAEMEKYNRQDVVLLEKLYQRLLPWIDQHPNMAHYSSEDCCTNCKSTRLVSNGIRLTITQVYRRLQCLDCGKWMRSRLAIKTGNPVKIRD